jgi:2-polyprenyl-6-methoxyphenol hydroxylase-like FAD-dependent oxidoreductase
MRCVKIQNVRSVSVELLFENGDLITADLVAGTDGMNSCVRDYIVPERMPKFTSQVSVIGFAKKSSSNGLEEIDSTEMTLEPKVRLRLYLLMGQVTTSCSSRL